MLRFAQEVSRGTEDLQTSKQLDRGWEPSCKEPADGDIELCSEMGDLDGEECFPDFPGAGQDGSEVLLQPEAEAELEALPEDGPVPDEGTVPQDLPAVIGPRHGHDEDNGEESAWLERLSLLGDACMQAERRNKPGLKGLSLLLFRTTVGEGSLMHLRSAPRGASAVIPIALRRCRREARR